MNWFDFVAIVWQRTKILEWSKNLVRLTIVVQFVMELDLREVRTFTSRRFSFGHEDLNMLTRNSDIWHTRRVKTDSNLNNFNYYHVFENRSFDIIHAVPEGIIPYKTGCVLHEIMTVQKFMSLEELNRRIK